METGHPSTRVVETGLKEVERTDAVVFVGMKSVSRMTFTGVRSLRVVTLVFTATVVHGALVHV